MKPSLSFDALTLHAVADELRETILGAQVQKIVLVGEHALGLELYGRGLRASLLIATDPRAARICLTSERPSRASEAVTPLLLLLRKYVRDGRVEDIRQPPLERVLELRVSKRDDGGDLRQVRLIIEVMGRRSNTVLVSEDGTILDAFRRASREKNPTRPIVPHARYELPPPQDRRDAGATDTWDHVRALAGRAPGGALADLLASELRGFSPLLAREASFRGAGRPDARSGEVDWAQVREAVADLLAPARGRGPWAPSVARAEGCVVAFAAYRLRHLEASCAVSDVPSISEAVEQGYRGSPAAAERRPSGNGLARPLLEAIDARRAQVERRRAALARAREAAGDPEALREAGQAIFAAAHQIEFGQESLSWEGREIQLDPRAGAVENAQRYFRDYKKARESAQQVPKLLGRAALELAHLDEMRTLVELADHPERVRVLAEELRGGGILKDRAPRPVRGKRHPAEGARPITVPLDEGFVALVGTSAKGNARVTFELAGQQDVWLHARQMPGAHVIVRTGGRDLPARVLARAAGLAAHFSRGRGAGRVPVDWTLRKYVRKIRGGPAGLVSYVQERTLDVAPRAPDGTRDEA